MNTAKKSCKYWSVCGSNENCKGCKGYSKRVPLHHCEQCGALMNPGDWMVGHTCLKCCRKNHKQATR